LRSPATSLSSRGRFGSTTRVSHRKETKRRKKKDANGSQDESDSTDIASPRLLHVGAIGPHQPSKTIASAAGYITDGFAAAVNRPVISTMLGVVIASFLFHWVSFQIAYVTRPVCSMPIISTMIPFCYFDIFKHHITSSSGQLVRRADYPGLVALQTKAFDQLLEEDVQNKGLALEANKAEVAGHNLITLVGASDLGGKDQIVERLSQFAADARGAGCSLRSIGVKIQGAVDS